MKTQNRILTLFLGLLLPYIGLCQIPDIGLIGGGGYYFGDVGRSYNIVPKNIFYGGFIRHNFNKHFSIRATILKGEVSADDNDSKRDFRQNRNLSFKSPITEFSTQIEFNFFPYKIGTKHNKTTYVFLGVGVLGYNPMGEFNGEWYDLRPLCTEGQGLNSVNNIKPYSKVAICMPFGVGYKHSFSKRFSCSLEWGLRKTSTDYLDDASGVYFDTNTLSFEYGLASAYFSDPSGNGIDKSGQQRANSKNKDWYSIMAFTFSYKLWSKPEACNRFDLLFQRND